MTVKFNCVREEVRAVDLSEQHIRYHTYTLTYVKVCSVCERNAVHWQRGAERAFTSGARTVDL